MELVNVSKPFEYKWETNKYNYEGVAYNRTWSNHGTLTEQLIRIPKRQRIKDRSKYMPHQGKQEMSRRVNVNN